MPHQAGPERLGLLDEALWGGRFLQPESSLMVLVVSRKIICGVLTVCAGVVDLPNVRKV